MSYWIMGRDADYDPQGRKHRVRDLQATHTNERLAKLKARTDEEARWVLDRFQQLRDKGLAGEAALDQAEDEWDEAEQARQDAEDTGRWYRAPNKDWHR